MTKTYEDIVVCLPGQTTEHVTDNRVRDRKDGAHHETWKWSVVIGPHRDEQYNADKEGTTGIVNT